jgi:hypothetical protein
MKILFVMSYPGYLRYYDSTVHLLIKKGHTVYLAFDRPEKQSEGLEALKEANEKIIVLGQFPRRKDEWGAIARGIRAIGDYIRYLDPLYAQAIYLRNRRKKALDHAPRFKFMTKIQTLPHFLVKFFLKTILVLEKTIPSSPEVEEYLTNLSPDLILVTPLVSEASPQTDVVKSAQALGIKVALCVASWDNLTNKGFMRIQPDRVIVWNEIQKSEAQTLHFISPDKIVVTGAQPFDRWFHRKPSTTREEFCQKVGLKINLPFILFVGSTAGISAPDTEERFVRQWIQFLRNSREECIRNLGVLIRPHPYNPGKWEDADLSDLDHVTVWPRKGANPVNEGDRNDYFDSLYHSAAVVGINTSAMLEAAIVGRSVHTVLDPQFQNTQTGTLHFHYLLSENGGFVQVASNLEEHLRQLSDTLKKEEEIREKTLKFVKLFIRPHGLERPSTPILVDAIEELGKEEISQNTSISIKLSLLTFLLQLIGEKLFADPASVVKAKARKQKLNNRMKKLQKKML